MGFGKMHLHRQKAVLFSTEARTVAVFTGSFMGKKALQAMLLQCPTLVFLCDHSCRQVITTGHRHLSPRETN